MFDMLLCKNENPYLQLVEPIYSQQFCQSKDVAIKQRNVLERFVSHTKNTLSPDGYKDCFQCFHHHHRNTKTLQEKLPHIHYEDRYHRQIQNSNHRFNLLKLKITLTLKKHLPTCGTNNNRLVGRFICTQQEDRII